MADATAPTGVRNGEALYLTVPDFDTNANVVLVRGRKTQLDRLVPLHDTLTHALTDYLASPERMQTTPSADGPIFVRACQAVCDQGSLACLRPVRHRAQRCVSDRTHIRHLLVGVDQCLGLLHQDCQVRIGVG